MEEDTDFNQETINRATVLAREAHSIYEGSVNLRYALDLLSFGSSEKVLKFTGLSERLRRRKISKTLSRLEEAFEAGYIPGALEPIEWNEGSSLISLLDWTYHPENKEFTKEMVINLAMRKKSRREYQKQYGKDFIIPLSEESTNGYAVGMLPEAMMDLVDPQPMRYPHRKIEFGNPHKEYWLNWVKDIRKYI